MARNTLIIIFSGIFLAMISVTVYASLDRSLWDVGPPLTSDPWFHATLADAYFGFLIFYVWVFFQEKKASRKAIWFVLIMCLGNIAMSVYVLIRLRTVKSEDLLAVLKKSND